MALLVALAACTKPNPVYCDEARMCSGGLVCDLARHLCIEKKGEDGRLSSPTVVATTPANDDVGIRPDSSIIITFSAPMDQASVESAWTSGDLPTNELTFAWNPTGDTLTITPNAGLPIATGTGLDPTSVTAMRIGYAISTSALDAAGTPLANQLNVAFATIRRLTHDVSVIDSLTNTVVSDNTVFSPSTTESVGDSGFTSPPCCLRVFVSFMLPTLPQGASLRGAEFRAPQSGQLGTPYPKLGILKAQHVNFASFATSPYDVVPIAFIGNLSSDAVVETKTLDVTARVVDDYSNAGVRGGRSQYRLEFGSIASYDAVNDRAYFTHSGFKLRLTYDVD